MSETPRTDAARAEYKRWADYVEHYGHIPEAMEQAPADADPFEIAETLERELAEATRERDEARWAWDVAEKSVAEHMDERDALRTEVERLRPTSAAADVLAERSRQVNAEGWTPEHDDKHADGSLALAASCCASVAAAWAKHGNAKLRTDYEALSPLPYRWPWAPEWWKPKSQRRDLVRAAALLLAEIERLDRAALTPAAKTEEVTG